MASIDASTIFLLSFALMLGAEAFLKPCIYQSDKCGFTLMSTYGNDLAVNIQSKAYEYQVII